MSKVYVVKYERELDNVDDVVYVTTDKSKAEEIVETFISVDTEIVYVTNDKGKAEEVVETFVKELCWIEEYPLDTIIPDIDDFDTQIQCEEYYRTP